ncbi:M15 family metallopeptidase [Thalassotalea ganghwensis]
MNEQQALGKDDHHVTRLSQHVAIHNDLVPVWTAIKSHAKNDGIDIAIASGFRDFNRQLSIWNRKFTGELPVKNKDNEAIDFSLLTNYEKVCAILTYSALPGASRHHWGSDVDIYAANMLPSGESLKLEAWEYQQQGYFYPLTTWLAKHVKSYQCFFPYRKDNGGIAIEPWHMSYHPIAEQYDNLITLELIADTISDTEIAGKKVILDNIASIYKRFIKNITKE